MNDPYQNISLEDLAETYTELVNGLHNGTVIPAIDIDESTGTVYVDGVEYSKESLIRKIQILQLTMPPPDHLGEYL